MKRLYTTAFLLLSLVLTYSLSAQDKPIPDIIRDIIENIVSGSEEEEEFDIESLHDMYMSLLEDPVNLNNASAEELAQLHCLSDFQIQSLLEYRKEYGELFSIHELALIHGYNEQIAAQIAPFVTIRPVDKNTAESFFKRFLLGKHQLLSRTSHTLETRNGYRKEEKEKNNHYLGFPWSLYFRYQYKYKNNLQWGVTATNGAGEPFFKGINPYGFDHYSAYIMIGDVKLLKRIIIGDFQAQFGQGLVLWSNGFMNKSANISATKKQERGFIPHTGSNETNFFRGVAGTLVYKQWSFSSFISYKYKDASLDSIGFTSLQTSGMHNTVNTASNKHTLGEFISGGNVSFKWKILKIGCTGLWHTYDKENNREFKPYNRFELSRKQNTNIGIDIYSLWKKICLFGEIGFGGNGKFASVFGLLADLPNSFQLSILYRKYDRAYQAIYSSGFGENSKTANEQGWYLGLQWILNSSWTITAYADIFSFPWLKYGINAPSSGWEYRLQANWQSNPGTIMSFVFRQSTRETNDNTGMSINKKLTKNKNTGIRYNLKYELIAGLRMENRIDISLTKRNGTESGILVYHDVNYKLVKPVLDFSGRIALFDTDSWSSRLYAYESDVLYAFSVPAYYSKGVRWSFNIHTRIGNIFDIWFHIAQTRYIDKTSIGSGPATIEGSRQTDIKLQIKIQL